MFLVQRGELEGRLDCYGNYAKKFNSINSIYPSQKLSSLVKTFSGGTPDKSKPNYWNGDIHWVSPKDFGALEIFTSEDMITEAGLKNSATKLIPKGNILMVVRSGILQHTLPVSINTKDVTINQDIKALIIQDNKVTPYYLAHFLRTFQDKILSCVVKHSTTVQSVNTKEFENLQIPIPPLNIQQQIVAQMQAAYAEKQQKEAQAAQLLASIDGYLLEKLGITLPQAVEKKKTFVVWSDRVSGGRFDPAFYKPEYIQLLEGIRHTRYEKLSHLVKFSSETWNQKDYFKDDFPYIEISEINLSKGIISNVNQVKILEAPSRAKMIVRKGDIIISTTRPNRGAIAKISENEDFSIASTGFAILRHYDKSKIVPNYLHTILRHRICLTQMEQRSSGGNYPAITQDELGNINIPIPSISVQQEIVLHLEKITKQAQQLETEAKTALAAAKRAVEKQILGYTRYKMDCEKS
jgi:type I restriction enzyme, S subunit